MNFMCDYGYVSKTVKAKRHVRSRRVSSRLCCMPVDVSERGKPTDTISSALSLLSRAVGKSAIDLKGLPGCNWRQGLPPGSARSVNFGRKGEGAGSIFLKSGTKWHFTCLEKPRKKRQYRKPGTTLGHRGYFGYRLGKYYWCTFLGAHLSCCCQSCFFLIVR